MLQKERCQDRSCILNHASNLMFNGAPKVSRESRTKSTESNKHIAEIEKALMNVNAPAGIRTSSSGALTLFFGFVFHMRTPFEYYGCGLS